MNTVEREHRQQLLEIHVKRLRALQLRAAQYGLSTDPATLMEIDEIQERVKELQSELQSMDKGTLQHDTIIRVFGIPIWNVTKSDIRDLKEANNAGTQKTRILDATRLLTFSATAFTIVGLLLAIIQMIASISSISDYLPAVPIEYVTLVVLVLAVTIGIASILYITFVAYRRQAKKRNLLNELLIKKESKFFEVVENDINTILRKGT
jgi:uncharacterized membrane protein (DUF106 family)